MRARISTPGFWIPALVAVFAMVALGLWIRSGPRQPMALRVPGTDQAPGTEPGARGNPVLAGKLLQGGGKPASLPGAWPQFRGPNRDGLATAAGPLAHSWDSPGPRQLWTVELGDGYAGATVWNGRVYVMDYDLPHKQNALRCLSAQDGQEIWRYTYAVPVKRNHGMSRTVPAVNERCVVAMGPKCHVVCLDPVSGQLRWGMDLVKQYGATVPPWYAGQCPLLESNVVILAPGGPKALLLAAQAETGSVLWQTPNPHAWKMTHSSIMPLDCQDEHMYVYCANNGVVGVSARDGSLLWESPAWKISIATVPSPVIIPEGRIFLSGGYNAGSLMLQVKNTGSAWQAQVLFKLPPEVFGATQQTPVFYQNQIYGVRADGRFVCLDLDGKVRWTSDGPPFGLGPFVLAEGLVFALNDSGLLRLIEATPDRYRNLAQAQVLQGRESWGPLAIADGRLYARDLSRMVCLEVARR